MKLRLDGALCATLALLGTCVARADVWIARDGVLERRSENGAVVRTISSAFGAPIGERILQGEVDPTTGNIWLALLNRDEGGREPVVRITGLTPSGEEIWQRTETGVNFSEPSFAIDSSRGGIWVLRPVGAQYNNNYEAVLIDRRTGNQLARVRGLGIAGYAVVAADGAVWIAGYKSATASRWIRLQGTAQQLDGYRVDGATGPHHRVYQTGVLSSGLAADPIDGGIYFSLNTTDPTTDEGDIVVVKYSARGDEIYRRPYPWVRYMAFSDYEVDPRDSSLYLTAQFFGAFIAHISPLGAEIDRTGFAEHNDSIALDLEDSTVWVAEMPQVDDDLALIAPMNLRKLDESLQTLNVISFPGVVKIIDAVPPPFVRLDIQPQRNDDLVNLGGTEVRVALLSSASLDPLQIDVDTIRFGTAGAVVRYFWTRDVNGDGNADLVAVFRTGDTGIKCGDTAAPLIGTTYGGVPVYGTGRVRTQCP